jgi:hypothetical protein
VSDESSAAPPKRDLIDHRDVFFHFRGAAHQSYPQQVRSGMSTKIRVLKRFNWLI